MARRLIIDVLEPVGYRNVWTCNVNACSLKATRKTPTVGPFLCNGHAMDAQTEGLALGFYPGQILAEYEPILERRQGG